MSEDRSRDLNEILGARESERLARQEEQELVRRMLEVDEQTANRLQEERRNKVSGFRLNLDLGEEDVPAAPAENEDEGGAGSATGETTLPEKTADGEKTSPDEKTTEPAESAASPEEGARSWNPPVAPDASASPERPAEKDAVAPTPAAGKKKKKKGRTAWGCVRGLIYGVLVLAISGVLAYFLIAGGLDLTGLNKSDKKVPVTLTEEDCKSTASVAKVLKKAGVIDQPLIFELYCKFTDADGKFQPQEDAALSPDMGYETIINILKATKREVVRVTFPEGSTIAEMAELLEKNRVCTASEFYEALNTGSFDYDFLLEIPDDEEHAGRFYRLEGYLFPDTYDFYVGSSGETAVRKFLDAFDARVDVSRRTAMKAKGLTLNDVITLASIIQWEADNTEDMYRVSRVLTNRLNHSDQFPRLECDSTRRYINSITPPVGDEAVENLDYDTYKRKGLPVGAINNPGLDAIDAAMNPSDDSDVADCYFFATDLKTGKTYYSKTLAEHERICRKYGIGMYA